MMMQIKRWMPLLAALLTIAALLAARGFDPAFIQAQRAAGFDTLQRVWPRTMEAPQPVRVVDIDEAALQKLGQWPWPRTRLAELTRNLKALGAATIAFDIVFPEPDRLSPRHLSEDPEYAPYFAQGKPPPDTDQEFASALSTAPTILAFARGHQRPATSLPLKSGMATTGLSVVGAVPQLNTVTGNIVPLETAATGLGSINIDLAGEQGVARAIALVWSDGTRLMPALSLEALRVAQGENAIVVHGNADAPDVVEAIGVGAIDIPVTEQGVLNLHFRKDDAELYVSARDVLDASQVENLRARIEGHIVLVGTSATGLLDARTTSLGETVPGVSIHAQALEQILSGRFLSRPNWLVGAELLGATLLALGAAALATFARPAMALGFAIAAALAVIATTAAAFVKAGLLLDSTFPLLLLVGSFVASTAWRLLFTDRQGRLMRNAFGHYVAPSILAEIEKNPESFKLGGEVREITVLFLDIANFTPLSEKLKPDELVSIVNGLWDVCSKEILLQHGTIDKFIGDAIMAFWNAPLPCDAHQAKACKAALSIREAVNVYNHMPSVRQRLEDIGAWPLGIRVGIATGQACVGNMGSSERFDYSVIGETVNTAARAEAACKHVGHDIVVAGHVAKETAELALLNAGHVALKGRSSRQPIVAVVGTEDLAQSDPFKTLQREVSFLVKPTRKQAARAELLKELALHHPLAARFLEALPNRSGDYQA